MKTIGLMSRKPGVSRPTFRAYYEEQHAPLACRYFPFRKYVRNHVVASRPDEIDYDVLSEFYFDTPDVAASAYSGEVAALMTADEANFMNSAMTRPLVVEERIVFGPARVEDRQGARRAMYLLRDRGAERRSERLNALAAVLTRAPGALRISTDCVSEGLFGAAAAADGFVSVWLDDDAALPHLADAEGFVVAAAVLTEIGESYGAAMKAAFGAR